MDYLEFLTDVHRRLQPQAYLEVGVSHGASLTLARCRAVGVDPAFSITSELHGEVELFRQPSDAFFAAEPLAPTGGRPYDLAFIDGLHLFEFAFRDFLNTERVSRPGSLVVVDDVLPRNVDEAARERHTREWTGDVYPLAAVLARYRPDLTVIPVSTTPTGMLLVAGLDPDNRVLSEHYHAIMAEYRQPDPQPVPEEILRLLTAVVPERVLASPLIEVLAEALRDDQDAATVQARVREVCADAFGPAYA